jgi:hypothetical protein
MSGISCVHDLVPHVSQEYYELDGLNIASKTLRLIGLTLPIPSKFLAGLWRRKTWGNGSRLRGHQRSGAARMEAQPGRSTPRAAPKGNKSRLDELVTFTCFLTQAGTAGMGRA